MLPACIDHPRGGNDDVANAVGGALVTAHKEPGVKNFNRKLVYQPPSECLISCFVVRALRERVHRQDARATIARTYAGLPGRTTKDGPSRAGFLRR
jgi:hypothetical protein